MNGLRCELTELLVTDCAHCRGITEETLKPPKWSGPSSPIPAAYPGRCSGCGERITPGDLILSDKEGGWLGACCLDAEPAS